MNPTETEQLLQDVLAEGHPMEFREKLLGETLRGVRRRRRFRAARRVAAGLAALVVCGTAIWTFVTRHPASALNKVSEFHCKVVHTRPLPVTAVVATQRLATNQLIDSTSTAQVVATVKGDFRTIGDDELLALVGPRPALLIRLAPGSEMLVLVDPKDRAGFRVD